MKPKIPISILVVIFNSNNEILLLKRTGKLEFWQSVTGSIDYVNEPLNYTAIREVFEETGIKIKNSCANYCDNYFCLHDLNFKTMYKIYDEFLYRYPPNTYYNEEHWFMLKVPNNTPIKLSDEHSEYKWIEWKKAIDECLSPSNKQAIEKALTLALFLV